TVDENPGFAELASLARKAEAVGCSAFVLPDHLIGQYAAMPLLAMVAAVTERLRVGTFVLNVCLRHPAVLAPDLATVHPPSGGRGAARGRGVGNTPGPAAPGSPCGRPGDRSGPRPGAPAILRACFAEGLFSFRGDPSPPPAPGGVPRRARPPPPPIFLGGGGR